jgi:hypothetical protein
MVFGAAATLDGGVGGKRRLRQTFELGNKIPCRECLDKKNQASSTGRELVPAYLLGF